MICFLALPSYMGPSRCEISNVSHFWANERPSGLHFPLSMMTSRVQKGGWLFHQPGSLGDTGRAPLLIYHGHQVRKKVLHCFSEPDWDMVCYCNTQLMQFFMNIYTYINGFSLKLNRIARWKLKNQKDNEINSLLNKLENKTFPFLKKKLDLKGFILFYCGGGAAWLVES